ncbi:hypothetical protein C1646_704510 [Rhizophagus diaphanus]|nr:hypothetical protein C1646_704510 [Rhizophagus diaphanus] [Rhizophagus sp. MUCL 43196]
MSQRFITRSASRMPLGLFRINEPSGASIDGSFDGGESEKIVYKKSNTIIRTITLIKYLFLIIFVKLL